MAQDLFVKGKLLGVLMHDNYKTHIGAPKLFQAVSVVRSWPGDDTIFFFHYLLTHFKLKKVTKDLYSNSKCTKLTVSLFQIVMVSPGTHLVKNHESGLLIFCAAADLRNSGFSREIPRNSPKNVKYREIRQKYFQIQVSKTYFVLILAIRPVLFTLNVQFILKLRHCNEQTTSQNYQAFLDERCKKLGTSHNLNSFSIRSFFERTVVERANYYPY